MKLLVLQNGLTEVDWIMKCEFTMKFSYRYYKSFIMELHNFENWLKWSRIRFFFWNDMRWDGQQRGIPLKLDWVSLINSLFQHNYLERNFCRNWKIQYAFVIPISQSVLPKYKPRWGSQEIPNLNICIARSEFFSKIFLIKHFGNWTWSWIWYVILCCPTPTIFLLNFQFVTSTIILARHLNTRSQLF